MSYKYFNISDMSLEEWTKVFAFCLKKADSFYLPHIHHYDKLEWKDKMLFDTNGVKTEQLWHFDYNFEYINVDSDGVDKIQKLYQKVLDASDFVYLCLPVAHEIQTIASLTIKSLMREGKAYEESSTELGNKRLSNVAVCGNNSCF